MIIRDFSERTRARLAETRARLAETRAVVAKLRELSKGVILQVEKINKQHVADRTRVYDRLGQLADDVVDKLPEEATKADADRAYVIQGQINDLASDVDEVSLAGTALEDLSNVLADLTKEIYTHLKEAEVQLSKVERVGAKIGI
jgi:hypothetical protein